MRVIGVDFTSAPTRRKPITWLVCEFDGKRLKAGPLRALTDFASFEAALLEAGPWICGIDFPFGQSRRFIQNVGWPAAWNAYVCHAQSLGRIGFRNALESYKEPRMKGDKEHRRNTDLAANSISPQKLFGVPVALMFFEGAPRLVGAGVQIPHLHAGDPDRIVVEAYPGALARSAIGRRSYKNDSTKKQTAVLHSARRELFEIVTGRVGRSRFGFDVEAPRSLADDPSGDQLDALLCAIQAAWAWTRRDSRFGAPATVDELEGWIVLIE